MVANRLTPAVNREVKMRGLTSKLVETNVASDVHVFTKR
jgi:hypothetical protein